MFVLKEERRFLRQLSRTGDPFDSSNTLEQRNLETRSVTLQFETRWRCCFEDTVGALGLYMYQR